MRNTVQTLESLRQIVRLLEKENESLRSELLSLGVARAAIDITKANDVQKNIDEDQGNRIDSPYINVDMIRYFYTLFRGRDDVYAKRGSSGGYFPQCIHRWDKGGPCPIQKGLQNSCKGCLSKAYTPVSLDVLRKHLLGSITLGIYPLLSDGTCRFLVFDFDNHDEKSDDNSWMDELSALRKMCSSSGIPCLVERSRSGRGGHLWILFKGLMSASRARLFGSLLLEKGSHSVGLSSFKAYDRMFPTQDSASELGNAIALPLQGAALEKGNSCFVDENWNAHSNQWEVLYQENLRIPVDLVEAYISKWQLECGVYSERPKPWKRNDSFSKSDVEGSLYITLADGIYVDTLNIKPNIQNQIRALASFDNPIYYRNKSIGISNYNTYSSIYMGSDRNGYICIPRGLLSVLLRRCKDAEIPISIDDRRCLGRPLRMQFQGALYPEQEIAAQNLLFHKEGILSAATAFGKTVVSSYLIAKRSVSTLVLVNSKELLSQWEEELGRFLQMDEPLPEYTTKSGKKKTRSSHIGVLHGGKDSLNGLVDIAMMQSVYGQDNECRLRHEYGMVIVDECHHGASATAIEVLQNIKAKYVYGVSATLKRSDRLDPIITMLIGPVRHSYTSKERTMQQGIAHLVMPRYTRTILEDPIGNNMMNVYGALAKDTLRNELIVKDVKECIEKGRSPVILTRFKDHAKELYERLRGFSDGLFLLYGDNSEKENRLIREEMKAFPRDKSMILIATGSKIGEGYNYPRLDTLILANPVSDGSRLEQFVGRINRDYPGKASAMVYDYIDSHVPILNASYGKRLRTYKRIGFEVVLGLQEDDRQPHAIYTYDSYQEDFEKDFAYANQSIIISSSEITEAKLQRFLFLAASRQEAGVQITVLLQESSDKLDYVHSKARELEAAGIKVILKKEIEHFAIFDNRVVWHGSVNFLGKEDIYDNLIRITSADVANELRQMCE